MRDESRTLIAISHKTYVLDRRLGALVNIHNDRDLIPFQAVEEHLVRLAKGATQDVKDQCQKAAVAFDEALGRPFGTTSGPVLVSINAEYLPASPPHQRFERRMKR